MRYPTLEAVGSTIPPKLLGTYEKELHKIVERLCHREYSEVLDIGCAEGYYAVGLGLRLPKAQIFAFDIDSHALELCLRMARANAVDRIQVFPFCDAEQLATFSFRQRGLLVADCEGFERELFTTDSVRALVGSDVLVEVHAGVDSGIPGRLRELFSATHSVTEVRVLSDDERERGCTVPELALFDAATRRLLIAEKRSMSTGWMFFDGSAEPAASF